MPRRAHTRQLELNNIFERACKQWESGKLRSAFRLFLSGAKAGDSSSQVNLGTFYSDGIGVRPSRTNGLYWYRRAYRQGSRAAASNIAVVYLNEGNEEQALGWFQRAINLRDGDASVEVAKIYLKRGEMRRAKRYLRLALWCGPEDLTEAAREEAERLLRDLKPI
jgi:TPR repeat protein